MKPSLPPSIDRMPLDLRDKRAGPMLDPDEAICNGLIYAMQFEFWKRNITANSQVVASVREAIRLAGYSIVPTEREKR